MGEGAKLVGAFETLIKRGGFRGVGVTLVSQRSASLNKDVLSQVETLIAMRTLSPQDRKAISGWVDQHAAGGEAVAELPNLADGEAWVFSPQWLQTLTKVRFRRRRTFDSGATPKVGGRPRPPATLAEVDLAAIKDAMAETIERAEADNPALLRQRIRRLEQQLAAQPPVVERVEVPVPVLPPETAEALSTAVDQLRALYTGHAEQLEQARQSTAAMLDQLRTVQDALKAQTGRLDAAVQKRPTSLPAPPAVELQPAQKQPQPPCASAPATAADPGNPAAPLVLRSGARRR